MQVEPMHERPSIAGAATLIDDDPSLSAAVRIALRGIGVDTQVFYSAEEFLSEVHDAPDGCLLVDLNLGGASGLELLRTVRKLGWETPAIVVSGTVTVPEAMDAVEYGVFDVVQKPLSASRLQEVVSRALSVPQPQLNRGVLRQRVEQLSDNERCVLSYLLEGKMNKSIAISMDIGLRSVVRHKQNVLKKLGFKEAAILIQEWSRLEMDAPKIGPSDACAALPQRVREEILLNINDVTTRLNSCVQNNSNNAPDLNGIIDDLSNLTKYSGLLSPGESVGQPRSRPHVLLLSDSEQESILLAQLLRLNQYFPNVNFTENELLDALDSACGELPLCVILNGDRSAKLHTHVLGKLQSVKKQHHNGVLIISSYSDGSPSSVQANGVWQGFLGTPFDPQNVIALIMENINSTTNGAHN